MVICSIYDSKAEAWLTPLFFQSEAQAVRSFSDAVNNAESDYYRHPEDYVLFGIGSWDPENGSLVQTVQKSLAVATVLKQGDGSLYGSGR